MKPTVLILLALLGTAATSHAQQPDLTGYLNAPRETTYRGDEPRGRILSFNSREQALARDVANSTYIQWLDGSWKAKRFAGPSEIDPALTGAQTDPASWSDATVPESRTTPCWATVYRREFKMPFAWIDRQIFLHVGAVQRAYIVYVNGKPAGYHEDSKTGVDFDITPYVIEGKNHLAIVAYAAPRSATLENQDTSQGTAITQDVYIMAQPKVRIRDYVFDAGFDAAGINGLFNFGAIVKSHLLNPKEVTVHYELIAPDSTVVSSGRRDARFEMRLEDTVRFFANIPNIQTWSHESPKLYTVVLRLQHEGRYTEYMAYKIGFRSVELDQSGIRINGQRVALRGIDFLPPTGEQALREAFAALRRQEINLVRVANYPQDDLFYALADQYGIYVCNTANIDTRLSGDSRKKGGSPANDPQWEQAYTERVLNMYHTSKNHPSVILFSLGREGGQGYNAYEAYLRLKEAERSRPVIYEGAGAEWNSDMVVSKGAAGRDASDSRPVISFGKSAAELPAAVRTNAAEAVRIAPADIAKGEISIENNSAVAMLSNFEIGYRINQRNRVIASGLLPASAPPGGNTTVTVPVGALKPGNYTITVSVRRAAVPEGNAAPETVAEQAFALTVPKPPKQ